MNHIKKIQKKNAITKAEKKLQEELKKSGDKANAACPELSSVK